MKLGRRPPHPEATHPRLKLSPTLAALPPVPDVVDRTAQVPVWPVLANDVLGDCVPAGCGHAEEAWTAYGTGPEVVVTDQDVVTFYELVGGYNPADPSTDQGCVIQDALGVWRKQGLAGHKIAAFGQLDVANQDEWKAALWYFGSVMIGVNLPQSAMDQFNNGQPWDVVADDGGILGGHCVILQHAGPDGWEAITWGKRQPVTAAWLAAYAEEAWAPISLEWLTAAGVAPEGLDASQLNAAFTQLTKEPGPFPVTPPTPPTPTPTPTGQWHVGPHFARSIWHGHHFAGVLESETLAARVVALLNANPA